jgi:hypothetical protein
MARLTTYSPNEVVLVVGTTLLTGLANDGFIKITNEAEDWTDEVGRDAEVTRSRILDNRATIEVVLTRSSLSNNVLDELRQEKDERSGPRGVRRIKVQDLNADALYEGDGFVMGPPEVTYGAKAENRTWKIRVAELRRVDKGAP